MTIDEANNKLEELLIVIKNHGYTPKEVGDQLKTYYFYVGELYMGSIFVEAIEDYNLTKPINFQVRASTHTKFMITDNIEFFKEKLKHEVYFHANKPHFYKVEEPKQLAKYLNWVDIMVHHYKIAQIKKTKN